MPVQQLQTSHDSNEIISINPANGDALGAVACSSDQDIKNAIAKAREAQASWAALSVQERCDYLLKLRDVVEKRSEEVARAMTIEMGMPITASRKIVDKTLGRFDAFTDMAEDALKPKVVQEDEEQISTVYHEPYGVAAVIAPWNFPIGNFALTSIQPLLAGNTVVYKLSEEVVRFGELLNRLIEEAGLPEGVFSQVFGDGEVGQKLISSPDIDFVHFTGSSATGRKIYQSAGENLTPVTLELGGSDAGIVFADADLDAQIENIFWAKFINAGQICCGLKRLLVEESVYDDVVQKLKDYIATMPVGDPMQEDTRIGPLAAFRQVDLLKEQVKDATDKGAEEIICGEIPDSCKNGAYYAPSLLLDITPEMRAWREELFGPVLTVLPFDTEDEAIEIANDTPYGLSGFVYTQDREKFERIARQMDTGQISHNGAAQGHTNPFGGWKESGIGRSAGVEGFHHATQIKVLAKKK